MSRNSHQVYYFNVTSVPSSQTIIDAELRVFRQTVVKDEPFIHSHGTTYRAKLYGKRMPDVPNLSPFESNSNLELLDSLEFDIADRSSENWNVFSVRRATEKWQKAKANCHQVELRVESVMSGKNVPPEEMGFAKAERLHNKHALLVVYTSDGRPSDPIRKPVSYENNADGNAISRGKNTESKQNKISSDNRVRRDAKSKTGGSSLKKRSRGTKAKRRRKKDSCRRKPLYVDFNQLSWSNWVIAPRGYHAYFCQGLCEFPIDNHLKPTNHATVQTILNSVAPSLAPQACCSPNKFSAISILYIDRSDSIVYKKYEDMVVERCGCKWADLTGVIDWEGIDGASLSLPLISGSTLTYRCWLNSDTTNTKESLVFIESTPDHELNAETESRCHRSVSFHRVLETFTDFQHLRVHCPRVVICSATRGQNYSRAGFK